MILSKALAVYLLALPILFYGVHSHDYSSRSSLEKQSNKSTILSVDSPHCSLCDLFSNVTAIFDSDDAFVVTKQFKLQVDRYFSSFFYNVVQFVALRGPPSQF
jgi:hypothetical protein